MLRRTASSSFGPTGRLTRDVQSRGQSIGQGLQQPHVSASEGFAQDTHECRIIIVRGEDGHAGAGPVQGVINEAAFGGARWYWHGSRFRKHAPDVKNGS